MLRITSTLVLGEDEIEERFVRSSGPGGQHVNKVATAVQLRFDVRRSPSLPDHIRDRLLLIAGNRISEDGILIIEARRFRTQERNRRDARERLISLLRHAIIVPKIRKPGRPTAASRAKRIEAKKRRGIIKRLRRGATSDGD